MSTINLEPCACKLCGKPPVMRLVKEFDKPAMSDFWQIACHHINVGLIIVTASDKESAVKLWNGMHSMEATHG